MGRVKRGNKRALKVKDDEKSKKLKTMALDNILSPTVVPQQYTNRHSPLPNFSWGDAEEVWNLMLHKDTVYRRNALLLHRHPSLHPRMRSILLDWLSEVCEVYKLHRDTYYLSIDFVDRYLSHQTDVPKQHLQLIGITCLFIAAKIEEIYPPKLNEFSYVTDGACTDSEIITKELVLLKALQWDLCPMTINNWLTIYMQLYATFETNNTLNRGDGDSFMIPEYPPYLFAQIAHLIDLCVLDIGSLSYHYSIIAASALYHFTNENIVYQCTNLKIDEIRDCIIWMVPFALAICDEGFDNPKILQKNGDDSLPNIQSHTVDLQLLEKAHINQMQQSANDSDDTSSSTSLSSPIASKTAILLTPPKSSSKAHQ